jgi:hypothetical protein
MIDKQYQRLNNNSLMEEHIMSKMTQKEAVFQAVTNVCQSADGVYSPTKEQRGQVNNILFAGFREGSIELEREYTDSELKAYVSGLQSNWLRKDKRLNGNTKYEAKNPGSRTGSTDAQVKAMRILLSTKTDASERAEIQSFIDKRVAEIKPSKSVTINVSDLPAELQHMVG